MRKLTAFSAVLIMASGAAFAQLADGISVQAWGRGAFVPLQAVGPYQDNGVDRADEKTEYYMGTTATWGGAPRVDLRINGNARYAGFTIHSNGEEGFGLGDGGAQLWLQPLGDIRLRFTVGNHFMVDTLRGKDEVATDTGFENFLYEDVNELKQDVIFMRFAAGGLRDDNNSTWLRGQPAFMVSSSPVQGLYLGLLLNGQGTPAGAAGTGDKLRDVLRNMHFGAGYEFPGVGHLRAQWIGGYAGEEPLPDVNGELKEYQANEPARVEAAFALTAVRGLIVDLGIKAWMPVTKPHSSVTGSMQYSNGFTIGLGANYRMKEFSITGTFSASDLGAYAGGREAGSLETDPAHIAFHLIPSYDFPFGAIGVSFGMKIETSSKDSMGTSDEKHNVKTGVGAFLKKGVSNGSFKIGAAFKLPDTNQDGAQGNLVFSIPFIMEYALF